MHNFIGQYLIARGLWHVIWYHGHQILILILALYLYGAYLNDDLGPGGRLLGLLLCVAAAVWVLRVIRRRRYSAKHRSFQINLRLRT